MVGFSTKNGSQYYVDTKTNTISGGIFKDTKRFYDDLYVEKGQPALIVLHNGQAYRTTKVTERTF
jgi:hypothetical protein